MLFRSDSADLIVSVDGLAYAYFGEKNYDAADAAYKRLLSLWEKSVGPTHPMMAVALDKVAVFYSAQKKMPEAMAAFERANAVRAHFFATGLSREATQAILDGNIVGAIPMYERALQALEPANPLYDEMRGEIDGNLKTLKGPGGAQAPKK